MEGLLEGLTSISVTQTPNSVAQPHPKYAEFKRRSKEESQELRRRQLLKDQKRLRGKSFDANRDLESVFAETRRPPRSIVKDKYKLMHSEWLVDIPFDLDTKWKMLLCPEGKRVLAIAAHGTTKLMNRRRQEVANFNTVLPGGNLDCPHELTVLDCIWDNSRKTLFVLDMLCWAHHDVVNCEAEFRFFWLQCKFKENPNMSDRDSNQGYKFVSLETFLCEPALIQAAMSHFPPFPNGPNLDGVLFYHMEAGYMMGSTTPLVGWLKGYMIPDLLRIPVAAQYMESRPPGLTLQEYINAEMEVMMKRRHKNRSKKQVPSKMECDNSGANAEKPESQVVQPMEATFEEAAVPQASEVASVDVDTDATVSSELRT